MAPRRNKIEDLATMAFEMGQSNAREWAKLRGPEPIDAHWEWELGDLEALEDLAGYEIDMLSESEWRPIERAYEEGWNSLLD